MGNLKNDALLNNFFNHGYNVYYFWQMEYKGLSIQTDAFDFNQNLHEDVDVLCEIDFDFQTKLYNNKFISILDIQYFKVTDRINPLASVRTTLKFWVDLEKRDVACSERTLFAVKTQHRFTCFILYQKLKSNNYQKFYLPTPPDNEFFKAIKTPSMAELEFDENGKYKIVF